jgi:3D (Asp-Asp-Asp) domain-containing protein
MFENLKKPPDNLKIEMVPIDLLKPAEYNPRKMSEKQAREMASGKEVYIGAIANNCLKFGTLVEIDGETYTVEDRMNRRYNCDNFDIYMESRAEAVKFGRQAKNIKIYLN